jgi:4-hydroxythreonine-4-phosphate dehydrogenase
VSGEPPLLVFTQGDPAGIGPEILAKLALGRAPSPAFRPLLVAERAALLALSPVLPTLPWERLAWLGALPSRAEVEALPLEAVPVLDPVGEPRAIAWGEPGPSDARGAIAALDAGVALVRSGAADALVTAPLSKAVVARHHLPGFTGHTDYLARGCGLERYGRDYLMAFLAPDLQVALLTTHLPLLAACERVTPEAIGEALDCLARHAPGGRIAVAGLNPHAGEGGLLGEEDGARVAPAVAAARARGLDAHGPESPDSLFARARSGEFDWVLALYHDQGLIAVKTAAMGQATNWTLGLPYLRTSVDHGTAFGIAGRGVADSRPLAACVATTLCILAGELPAGRGERPGARPASPFS